MTYEEKLNAIRADLAAMASDCLKNNDVECAHEFTGACLVILNVYSKIVDFGLDEQEAPTVSEQESDPC